MENPWGVCYFKKLNFALTGKVSPIEKKREHSVKSVSGDQSLKPREITGNQKKEKSAESPELTDEEYWEEMLFISLGPCGWNIGCGCG